MQSSSSCRRADTHRPFVCGTRHRSDRRFQEKKIRRRVWLVAAAVAIALAIAAIGWVQKTERFWRNPIEDARFQTLTDFDGTEQAAAVSRDGKFVAFLSSRDGHTDVWVTQPGSGQFHNLTRGSAPELVNPSVRALGFSPDGSLVTFWVRKPAGESGQIGIWAVPTLGGQSRPYREGAAEFDWSHDGSRLAYHTAASGDPLFVSDGATHPQRTDLYRARGPAFSLSVVGARRSVHLRRLRRASRQTGHLAHQADGRNAGTDHVTQWARESSGVAESAYVDVPCQRSRRFRTVAVQHGRRAPHSSPAYLWSGPVHVTGRHGGRQAPGCHTRESEEHPLAIADR